MADGNMDHSNGEHGNSIKTMKLYSHVDRIYNELKEVRGEDQTLQTEYGYKDKDTLDPEVVSQFDQYHYYGTQAVDEAIKELDIRPCHGVLDVGSGLGGPARYIAHRTGCQVTAVEIQEDLHETAKELTHRCRLDDRVQHLHGNFIEMGDIACHDVIVSWLVFLHIQEKEQLFNRCFQSLSTGGQMLIEDFYLKGSLTDQEKETLKVAVFCENLPTENEYMNLLQKAGFIDIKFEDVTESWNKFVSGRLEKYVSNKNRHIKVHGVEVYSEQKSFYQAMSDVFKGGNLGGCKIIARRN